MLTLHDEKQTAARLGVSIRTLQQWRLLGTGPEYHKINRAVRYRPETVDSWILSQARAHTSHAEAA